MELAFGLLFFMFFFFKQKTAYEMRISDWSSDVCSSDLPDTGDFRLLSRKAVHALQQLNERNRYMKGLFAWIGLPTAIIEYDRMPRAAGATKWDYLGLLNLAFQGITSFSTAPLRFAMGSGLLTALFGVLFNLWIVIKRSEEHTSEIQPLMRKLYDVFCLKKK